MVPMTLLPVSRSRRRSRSLVAWPAAAAAGLLAVVAWDRSAAAQQPASQPVAATQPADADVAALIHKLGADDEQDRTAAQGQLVELGTTATDALQSAAEDHDADPEVRSRAAAALAEIRDRDVNGPTLITLHAHDADPTAVMAQVGKQAHADIVGAFAGGAFNVNPAGAGVGRAGAAKVTLDADRKPFWDVMADACGQMNVCPLLSEPPNHHTLRLFPTVPGRNWLVGSPHQVVGPFWVGLSELDRLSTVDLAGPPKTTDAFLARLIVFPEPKLVVTAVSPLVLREATDDAGNSLVPPAVGGGIGGRMFAARTAVRLPARTVEVRLAYPAHPGKRIVTLAGDLQVTLAPGSQRFEVDDVLGGHPTVPRPLAGVKVRVSVTRSNMAYYQVTVECQRDGLGDEQWAAMTNRVSDLTVEDASGHMLASLGWSADSSNTDTAFKSTGHFTRTMGNLMMNRMAAVAGPGGAIAPVQPGEPARVVWNVAVRFKVVSVPVAFHDLPMP